MTYKEWKNRTPTEPAAKTYKEWKQQKNTKPKTTVDSETQTAMESVTSRVNGWMDNYRSYLNDYNDRVSKRSGGQYLSDSDTFSADMAARKSALDTEADEIRTLMKDNRDYLDLDWMYQVNAALRSAGKQQGKVLDLTQEDSDFWASFNPTEEQAAEGKTAESLFTEWFDAYQKSEQDKLKKEEMSRFDIDSGRKEIAQMEADYETHKEVSDWYREYMATTIVPDTDDPVINANIARYNEFTEKYGSYSDLEATITQKKQYLNQAKRIQDGITLSGVAENADFSENSGYVSTKTDDWLDKLNSQFHMGYGDLTYEYINGKESGLRQEIIDKAVYYSEKTDDFFSYDYMTEDQIAIYNYHYAKEGKEAADKYLDSIRETLNYQAATERFGKMEDNTAVELLFGIEAGVDQFQSGMKSVFNTEDDYIAQTAIQMASGMVREDLADAGTKLPDWMGGASLGQVGYDAITTTTNMLPSVMTSTVMNFVLPGSGSVVGTAMMGASAAGNAYQEMLNLGYDKGQARAYSTLVGASEAGLQYLLGGIGKLGGVADEAVTNAILKGVDNAFARTAIKLGGKMVSEGFEEGLQEILTPWFQNLIMHTNESVNWSEVAYSTLLGALTAGVMEGVDVVSGEVGNYKTGTHLQVADISSERLAALGQTFSADTVAYQLAGRVNENTGAYTMGRLFNEIGATLSEQNVTEITEALVAKGMDGTTARKNAKTLAYVVEGGRLTDKQVAAIEANEVLAEAARTTLIDANTTWNQRAQGYNEMLKALADDVASQNTSRTNPAKQSGENATLTDTVDTLNESAAESGAEVDTSPAKVQRISSVENGQATIKLEDGSEVSLKDADLDPDEGIRIETIASIDGISAEDANFILNTLRLSPNASAQMDALGAKEAYKYGFYGFSQDHIAKHGVFANTLTESQRQAIYNTGREASQRQASQKEATVRKNRTVEKKTGRVHFEGNQEALTDRQRASFSVLEKVAEALGVQIYVFESKQNERGKRVGANGWYDPKNGSIHIDLHAGVKGEATMLFTAAHELTHFIRQWSPAKFKILADFLMEEYGKKNVNVDALVREQIAKAKRTRNEVISYDAAYEEVIADSMETMLADGKVMEKLAKLKAQDKTLWQKIKDFISELAAKIRSVYDGLSPDSVEGRHVAEMVDAIEKLQDMFTEALVEAGENYQASEQVLTEAGIEVNSKTDSGSLFSVRDVLDDTARGKVAKALASRFDVTEKEAMEWLSAETSLASLILNPKYSSFLDYEADPNEVAIKQNSDYPQGTVDFSNICKKRREFTQVMNRILRNFPNHVFAATDLAKIRTIMGEEGMTLPCGICYVEDRRQLDTIVAQDFIDGLKLYRDGSKTRPDGKPFNANQLKGLQLTDGDTYVPTIYELVSLEGRNSLKAKNPNMEAAWVRYNNARGMQAVRLLTNEAEYKRQILKYSPKTVKSKNDHGGLRIYSFSDAEMFHLIDIVQVITDSAAVGLYLQGYTKVNEYAKAVKDTGEKLNRSLIPKGALGYHIEDGKVVLDYDTVEGIDIYSEDFFDNKDNPDVGNITIGVNDVQIRAAMVSDFVDQIIPFHTGQSEEVLGEKGIAAWKNYKDSQTEKDLVTGKTASHQVNIYTDVIQAAENEGKPIQNKRQFVEKFLQVCKENGLQPRFAQFLNVDGDGNYVYTEGYHKFLVDFKTFAQTEVGEYLPQGPVKPIFDNAYITGLLKAYVKEQQVKDAEVAKQMPKVIERITNEIVKPAGDTTSGVEYSDRKNPYYGKTLYKDGEVYAYDFMVALHDMEVHTMPPLSSVKTGNRVDQDKAVRLGLENASSIGRAVSDGLYAIKNSYTGREILLGQNGLEHGLDGGDVGRLRTNARLSAIGGLIVQNSIPVNGLKSKNRQAKGTYAMACLLKSGDRDVVAIITVEEHTSKAVGIDYVDITHSINGRLRKNSEGSLSSTRETGYGLTAAPNAATFNVSVADFLEIVNETHRSILSQDVLNHFNEERPADGHYADRVLFSDRDYMDAVNRDFPGNAEDIAKEYFGTTKKWSETGWLLRDGIQLDFSGRHWERDPENEIELGESYYSGKRNMEHYEIAEAFPELREFSRMEYRGEHLDRFQSRGNIRIVGKGIVAIEKMPTEEQFEKLRSYFRENIDRVIVVGIGRDGMNFNAGTNPSIIIEGIRDYFSRNRRNQSELMRFHTMFSDRDTESVSNRSLLANAFASVAQNEIERDKMQEYKEKISGIEAEERKLDALNAQIKELSFAKGPRDKDKLRTLRDEATKTANRISIYDKQLLRLEASKPLQNVLEREKKKAYKRAEQRGKEALEEYREKTTKRQQELMDKWQESRKRGVESREKTAMRHKIQRVVGELNNLLLNGDKKHHVPDSLKKAVADALSLVNMDNAGTVRRIAEINRLLDELYLKKAEAEKLGDQEELKVIQASIDDEISLRDRYTKMGDRLEKLHSAYEKIQNSDDPDIANAYDPVIAGCLEELAGSIGDTSLMDMTIEQLADVYDMYRMVLTRVRDANKAFLNEKNEAISSLASHVVSEIRRVGGEHKHRAAVLDFARKFGWNNLKPVYAFEHIGSATLMEAFDQVRAGEDVWAKDVTEARAYYLDKSKKYGYESWDFEKKYRFASTSGLEFELTLEQILSLYAYSKREQAHDHLRLGGFVFDSNIETYKEKEEVEDAETGKKQKKSILKYKVNTADAHQISPDILADIIGNLSEDQKAFVDEMQDYLSTTMGAKGNEVTMKMYGVKLFKEKFYFPLKSAKQFMFEQNEVAGEVKIKNSGFTNKVVAKANNPVILNNFMDVWSSHVNDMSMYHAFVLPLEDFNRIFNYNSQKKEGAPSVSVKGTLQSAYTPAAVNYVKQLITDLNGGARTDPTTDIISKLMGKFKKGAVFASLSVVVQQPSAVARAAALVDTKYFIGPKIDHKSHDALWDEVKKYAPVALIKEMGYFDTNMGKSTQDFILAKEYSGFKEKMKALVTDSGYRDEVLSKAPALADEIAWCAIWEAVKRETMAQHPGMDAKSEPFLKLCGSRFTEVITKTQVYDSVLSRSALMRSKDTGMKMATAFMAEPTTSINMIADALLKGKRGDRKYCRTAIGAVIASQILNSILVSFVYAARDDDEDKTYAEKYVGTLTGEIIDSLNPAGYIPFIKDMVSIVRGYDVERSDMAVISDLWSAIQSLKKPNASAYRKVEGFAGSVAQLFGLPVKNIMRDVRSIYQTIDSMVNGQQTTKAGIGYAVKSTTPKWLGGGEVSNQQQLYEAYLSGDTEHLARVKARYKDDSAVGSALRKALRENDSRIREAAIAWNANDLQEYMRLAREIIAEKHFVQDDVVMAIQAEARELAPDDSSSSTSKAKGLFTAEKFAEAIVQGDEATANAIKMDIIETAQKNGKTETDAEDSFISSAKSNLKKLYLNGDIEGDQAIDAMVSYCGEDQEAAESIVGQWAFEQEYGFAYSDRAEAYRNGAIASSELRDILINVGGKTAEEAAWQVKVYDWQNEGFDIDSSQRSVVEDYETYCKPVGIDKNTYFDAFLFYKDSGEEGVAYSKPIECMPYIDSLPLSPSQKTALALCWWAESTVNKYKTW